MKNRIAIERSYPATLQEVWELWTTKEGIESWWGPGGFSVKVKKLDLRPGGELLYAMTAIDPQQIEFMKKAGMPLTTEARITFTEVVAPMRLAFTTLADFIPGVEPYDIATVVEFHDERGTVRMVLTFDAMHNAEWTKMATMGRESELEKLDQFLQQAQLARRENRPADAKRDLIEAVDLCRKSGVGEKLAAALKGLGQIERDLGHRAVALEHYEEAAAIYRAGSDALKLAHTIRHVADIHQDEGRVELAEPCYREALALYRGQAQTPPLDLANAIRGMALLKGVTGEPDEAASLWREARDLYEATGVKEGVAECERRLNGRSRQQP